VLWIQHGRKPQDCANPETLLKTNLNLPTDFAEEPIFKAGYWMAHKTLLRLWRGELVETTCPPDRRKSW